MVSTHNPPSWHFRSQPYGTVPPKPPGQCVCTLFSLIIFIYWRGITLEIYVSMISTLPIPGLVQDLSQNTLPLQVSRGFSHCGLYSSHCWPELTGTIPSVWAPLEPNMECSNSRHHSRGSGKSETFCIFCKMMHALTKYSRRLNNPDSEAGSIQKITLGVHSQIIIFLGGNYSTYWTAELGRIQVTK